jgi:hypothetical protein
MLTHCFEEENQRGYEPHLIAERTVKKRGFFGEAKLTKKDTKKAHRIR